MLEAVTPQPGPLLKHWLLTDLTEARRVLEASDVDLERAIHMARRRLKRVRTLFQMLKSVPGTGHDHRAHSVKEAFKLLSGSRDADAMLAAAKWIAHHAPQPIGDAATSLVDRLKEQASNLRAAPLQIERILSHLRIAESEAAALAEDFDPARLLRDRLIVVYRRGRKLYRAAADSRDDDAEALHDWRKQVKHRLHICQIIEGTGLLTGQFLLKDLDRLAEYLGEEHDFSNLAAWIEQDATLGTQPKHLAGLTTTISRRRSKLATRALEVGRDLYGQRTAQFCTRSDRRPNHRGDMMVESQVGSRPSPDISSPNAGDRAIATVTSLKVAMLLSASGGFLDAFTWLAHGHVFANAQTGNVVLLGVFLASGQWLQALNRVPPILAFLIAVFVAFRLHIHATRRGLLRVAFFSLGVEIVVLSIILFLPSSFPDLPIILAVAFVAALQSCSFPKLETWAYSSVMTTGNLRRTAEALFAGLYPPGDAASLRQAKCFALICSTFCLGAAAGAFLTDRLANVALLLPVGLLLLVLMVCLQASRAVPKDTV